MFKFVGGVIVMIGWGWRFDGLVLGMGVFIVGVFFCVFCDGVIFGEGDGDEDGGGECCIGVVVCNLCLILFVIFVFWGLFMFLFFEWFVVLVDFCIFIMKRSLKSCNVLSFNVFLVLFEVVYEKFRCIVGRYWYNIVECL